MKVFIGNFGLENILWPRCLERSVLATVEDADLGAFQLNGDKSGFISYCLAHKKTARGIRPTRPVASRWFNLPRVISATTGDLWIHREQDELWWTISANTPVQILKEVFSDRRRKHEEVFIYHKATTGWSNKTKGGRLLKWRALHPKATHFLATEGTLQELSPDNAEYARALIDGVDLAQWHSRPDWKAREHDTGRGAVTIFNARLRAVVRMAKTAFETAEHANGQQVLRTVKDKRCEFTTSKQLEDYLDTLILEQDSVCAITQLALQFDGETEDLEMLASLDRIDSDGHYAMGNLQVVCRFINRWKNCSNDVEFRRLIALLQGGLPD